MFNEILDKITTRSILAVSLTIFLGGTMYFVLTNTTANSNPLLLLVIGILATNFTTVIIFYFRKAQSKESLVNREKN